MTDFYETIAAVILDDADPASFLASADTGEVSSAAPTKDNSDEAAPPLGESDLTAAERNLADFIGPLASVLVRKAGAEATSVQDLYARLAEHITDEAERRRFLNAGETSARR